MTDLANRARDAHSLWHDNPVLVHLLGLTPLLALSTTVLLGATLLLTLTILLAVATAVSGLLLTKINASWRFLFHLGLLALLTTTISALLSAWAPALHAAIGIYLPLLSCSLLPLLHLQAAASRDRIRRSPAPARTITWWLWTGRHDPGRTTGSPGLRWLAN